MAHVNELHPRDTMSGGFSAWADIGMQWLVLGMGAGVEFLKACDTRDEARDWLTNEYNGKTYDFFAVVKARDLYAAP